MRTSMVQGTTRVAHRLRTPAMSIRRISWMAFEMPDPSVFKAPLKILKQKRAKVDTNVAKVNTTKTILTQITHQKPRVQFMNTVPSGSHAGIPTVPSQRRSFTNISSATIPLQRRLFAEVSRPLGHKMQRMVEEMEKAESAKSRVDAAHAADSNEKPIQRDSYLPTTRIRLRGHPATFGSDNHAMTEYDDDMAHSTGQVDQPMIVVDSDKDNELQETIQQIDTKTGEIRPKELKHGNN